MNVTQQFDIKIEKWEQQGMDKFIGANNEWLNYTLGITPQDPRFPDCCYFNVWVEKTIENSKNGVVFHAKTYNCFKVQNNGEKPTIEFFFSLIEAAGFEFAKMYHLRVEGTNLAHHKIPKPTIEGLRDDIRYCIDTWDKTIRNTSLN